MKITSIRNIKTGLKLSQIELETIAEFLEIKLFAKGFHTQGSVLNSSCIKLGLHSRCFSINTHKLGYNAIVDKQYKKGYKRTNVPIWEQRVRFNNLVNSILNKFSISATVKSGPFTIRTGTKVFIESDWYNQLPSYLGGHTTDFAVNGLGQVIKYRTTEALARLIKVAV